MNDTNSEARVIKVAGAIHAPEKAVRFAERMAGIHDCPVRLTFERSGYQLYMPCPECLHEHKQAEVNDPKYCINLSQWLHLGKYAPDESLIGYRPIVRAEELFREKDADASASICMRTRQARHPHRYKVSELLKNFQTVSIRHPDIKSRAGVKGGVGTMDKENFWEVDPVSGILAPPGAGTLTPVHELPDDHPAAEYLRGRNFDLEVLWDMFRCSFCTKEYPEGEEKNIFYRKMQKDWKDTPQNRIVFQALHDGVPLTWQARLIEKLSEDGRDKYMLHPYAKPFRWDHVATRAHHESPWIPVPPFDATEPTGGLRFKPSKYRTAKYSTREMLGWDAALRRAHADPEDRKWAVLVEGPLDGARHGPGGIPIIGSSLSPDNAAKLARNFHLIITAFDTDKAGREATERITRSLMEHTGGRDATLLMVAPMAIPEGKDIGEMQPEVYRALFDRTLRTVLRRL